MAASNWLWNCLTHWSYWLSWFKRFQTSNARKLIVLKKTVTENSRLSYSGLFKTQLMILLLNKEIDNNSRLKLATKTSFGRTQVNGNQWSESKEKNEKKKYKHLSRYLRPWNWISTNHPAAARSHANRNLCTHPYTGQQLPQVRFCQNKISATSISRKIQEKLSIFLSGYV